MTVVPGIILLFFVLVGIPLLCRMLIRRMAASKGFRQWLNAYGPPFLIRGRDEPDDDGADT